jgi:hypothetical protein
MTLLEEGRVLNLNPVKVFLNGIPMLKNGTF